jgi:hypothetical protein
MLIVDKCPKDGGWNDLQNQAHALLGEAPAKKVWIEARMNSTYRTSHINIEGTSKIGVTREPKLMVRVSYATTQDPFKGTLTITPRVDMKTVPSGLTKGDGDKPSYTADIESPNSKGDSIGDLRYDWTESEQQAEAPADLVVNRKWEKAGPDWGNCTIRIQSTDRWTMDIDLPNDKTNPTNCSIQPNEVQNGGKTFRYYNWYDLNKGLTITFPITAGTDASEYYPHIHLWRDYGRAGDKGSVTSEATESLPEYDISLKSDKDFPANINHPTHDDVILDEVKK